MILPRDNSSELRSRDVWIITLAVVVGPMALVIASFMVAHALRLDEDVVLGFSMSAALSTLTIVRPWWFWQDRRARWARKLIGDRATIGVYLLVAAGIAVVSGRRELVLEDSSHRCRQGYDSAQDPHERYRVNTFIPNRIPSLFSGTESSTCENLRERGLLER
jgi:hypothetical protein